MLRFRFSTGLILGLVLGVPAGALLVLLLMPAPNPDRVADLQVQELTRRLEAAKQARERADKQLEQFQKLAEQMTKSFESLETRFKALDEELQRRAEQPSPTALPGPS